MSDDLVKTLVEDLSRLPSVGTVTVISRDPLKLSVQRSIEYPSIDVFAWSSRELPPFEHIVAEVRTDYSFTEFSYLNLPGRPNSGDFILLVHPDATCTAGAKQLAANAGVEIGSVHDLAHRIVQMQKIPKPSWPRRLLLNPLRLLGRLLFGVLIVALALFDASCHGLRLLWRAGKAWIRPQG
jgi:hypothetical protein